MIQEQREHAVDLWQKIAERLNHKINTSGKIPRNWTGLWDSVLHKLDNDDWLHLIWAMEIALAEDGTVFSNNNVDALHSAIQLFNDENEWNHWQNYNDLHPAKPLASVFDIPTTSKRLGHKKKMWKFMFALREVWNQATGIYLPNEDSSIGLLGIGAGVTNLTPAQRLQTLTYTRH